MPQTRARPGHAATRAREATGIGWDTLRDLARFRARVGCAVSVYMGLDPRVSPTAADVSARLRALVDEAHKRTEANRERRTHEQQASLREGLGRIQQWFESDFNRNGVRGLAVFSAPRDGLWRPLPLPVPVSDSVKFGTELYVAPLVPLAGDGNAALVAFVGRERGDLYELRDGRLGLVASRFEEQPRRHDQGGWSQANYQRHIDNLTDRHLRGFVEELEREVRRRRDAPLVVACSEETRPELLGLLSTEARAALAGWARAEAHAAGPELLAGVTPVLERYRAEREQGLVTRWHDAMGESGRASAGWEPTVAAVSDSRVDALLYSPRAGRDVWQCPSCGRLELHGGECPVDATELERCEDGLDAVIHRALAFGGRVHEVATRPDLDPVGGLGALLRF